jgi:hypothetical protein
MLTKVALVALAGLGGADAFSTSLGFGRISSPAAISCRSTRPARGGVVGLNAKIAALLFDCDGVLADTVSLGPSSASPSPSPSEISPECPVVRTFPVCIGSLSSPSSALHAVLPLSPSPLSLFGAESPLLFQRAARTEERNSDTVVRFAPLAHARLKPRVCVMHRRNATVTALPSTWPSRRTG